MTNNGQNTPEILETVKQLKANGSFDQFRKDCFSEIVTLPKYHDLTKQVEDYVIRFLKEQKPNSKKSIIRDKLRRSLNESYFLTQGINKLIEEILEPKLKSTFKPIINSMVSTTTSNATTDIVTPTTVSRAIISEIPMDYDSSNKNPVQKVSIEDFIPNEKIKTKLNNIKPQASVNKFKHSKSNERLICPKEKLDNKSTTQKKTCNSDVKVKNASSTDFKAECTKKTSDLLEDTLERDPMNEYRFNWHLSNQFEKEDYNELSISSAESNELSDFE